MKKLICLISLLLFVTGCGKNMNTPIDEVEKFLGKYQSMESEVLAQLDSTISNDNSMSDEQKKDYRTLMEKQYQNLSYKIKDESINDIDGEVIVEIEVLNYINSINESRKYYSNHLDEFVDEDFTDYKIKQLKDVNDKVKYEIVFHLMKKGNKWVIEDISDNDVKKIHGLYDI